jgi:hypothetical protein
VTRAPRVSRGRELILDVVGSHLLKDERMHDLLCGSLSGRGGLADFGPGLAWSPARPLARDDGSLVEDLAAPDSVWFGAVERAGQAGRAYPAPLAVRLGLLKLGGQFGEPQIAGYEVARQWVSQR